MHLVCYSCWLGGQEENGGLLDNFSTLLYSMALHMFKIGPRLPGADPEGVI